MKIAYLFMFACYVAPTLAGWYNCEPCRCHQTSYNVIAQCFKTNSPSERTLGSVPKGFNKDIHELQIRGHQIKTLLENNFEHYHNLEILDLSRNGIDTVKVHAFKNLIKLKDLILSFNELITLPTNTFQDTPNLTSVYLNNNKFTTLQKDLFSNLPHLEDVYIQNNSLLTVQENCFVNVPLLTTINLSRNQLTYISSKIFSNLNNMKTVNLAHNPWNCDIHLCEIMSITITRSWDELSSPVCHSPENKYGKSWRDVFNNNIPTITSYVSKSSSGGNVTLKCDICSVSGIIWIVNHQNVTEDDVEVADNYLSTSLLSLNGVNDRNNGLYSCRVKDCKMCEEDAMSLIVTKSSLEILRQMKNSKVAALNVKQSIKGIIRGQELQQHENFNIVIPMINEKYTPSVKGSAYASTPISTTFKSMESATTQVTEQILTATASHYINIKTEIETEISKLGSTFLYDNLTFYVIIPSLILIAILIILIVTLYQKNKSMKKKYVQKQSEQIRREPESEPLRNKNSSSYHPPTPPLSIHQSIQTEITEPINNNGNYSDETNQTNSSTTSNKYSLKRICNHIEEANTNNYNSTRNSTLSSTCSSSSGRTTTSLENFNQMIRIRYDSGYGSDDKPEYFVLNTITSYYNDETPD